MVGGLFLSLSLLLSCVLDTGHVLHLMHCVVFLMYACFSTNVEKHLIINDVKINIARKFGDLLFPVFSVVPTAVPEHLSDYVWAPFFIYAAFGYRMSQWTLCYFGSLLATYVFFRPMAPVILLNLCLVHFFDGSRRRAAFFVASAIHAPLAYATWNSSQPWEAFIMSALVAVAKAQFLMTDGPLNAAALSVGAFAAVPFLKLPASILCIFAMPMCFVFLWWQSKWRESDMVLLNPSIVYLAATLAFSSAWRHFMVVPTAAAATAAAAI